MIRAGKLDRFIVVERSTPTVGDDGTVSEEWDELYSLRAEVIMASTQEFVRNFGASSERAIVFRTWYADGITLADRVVYDERAYNILEVTEIGRRRGLEIRCLAVGP